MIAQVSAKPAGLLLAAGASRRMGPGRPPKALLQYRGETFFTRLQRILLTHCHPVVVVLGFHAESLRPLLAPGVIEALNPDPDQGMLSSLQTGLKAIQSDRTLFLPLDYPAVEDSTVAALAAVPAACTLALPRFEGKRGHPVLIDQSVARRILSLDPTSGAQARDVIRPLYDGAHFVDVADPGILMDVDTPGDYESLLARFRTPQ